MKLFHQITSQPLTLVSDLSPDTLSAKCACGKVFVHPILAAVLCTFAGQIIILSTVIMLLEKNKRAKPQNLCLLLHDCDFFPVCI